MYSSFAQLYSSCTDSIPALFSQPQLYHLNPSSIISTQLSQLNLKMACPPTKKMKSHESNAVVNIYCVCTYTFTHAVPSWTSILEPLDLSAVPEDFQ